MGLTNVVRSPVFLVAETFVPPLQVQTVNSSTIVCLTPVPFIVWISVKRDRVGPCPLTTLSQCGLGAFDWLSKNDGGGLVAFTRN
jgi:hypothetical protein